MSAPGEGKGLLHNVLHSAKPCDFLDTATPFPDA
ncbi:hypothetical protein SAMN05421819_2257 [Bryocella elongata]|uniref:Uncharacterized protein n=1 Tax=Bryocella elongata TaxID=863522 RepID=A0A1H5YDS6_9BACT|nr:hypothetical protein SAMN05421819_2257 [Bryocella elongata]